MQAFHEKPMTSLGHKVDIRYELHETLECTRPRGHFEAGCTFEL
jgi:hypothetical protein